MFYKSQLEFMCSTLEKCRLNTVVIDPCQSLSAELNRDLSIFFNSFKSRGATFYDYTADVKSNTLYRATDEFSCTYLFMLLPEIENEKILLIGPYLTKEIENCLIMEYCERFDLSFQQRKVVEDYYGSIPTIPENSAVFAMFDTFAQLIWGSADFAVNEIEHKFSGSFLNSESHGESALLSGEQFSAEIIEKRYSAENELLRAVSHGQLHKAETALAGLSVTRFEQRSSDPLRNIKNYCIIMNTLLRKAAESGGVHPVHLDRTSSAFAKKIENAPSTLSAKHLMFDMIRTYCRLVKSNSVGSFSSPVQKAITAIDFDLSADLSLNTLAQSQRISPAYLSNIFKKETGQTLTDFVNKKRIDYAAELLRSTNLQIQTIAQLCGILDVHYFSKLFKKHTKKTPKEYRREAEAR